jgi:hypothetical protein
MQCLKIAVLSGLDYVIRRYLGSPTGRFTSPDPVGGQAIGTCRWSLMFRIRRRRTFMSYLNRAVWRTFTVLWACAFGICTGQPGRAHIGFGFVSLTTAKAGGGPGEADAFARGIVVRLYSEGRQQETFVLTDEHGTALVPLRDGTYCGEAFGTDGEPLRLDTRLRGAGRRCFGVKSGKTVEFSLTIANGVLYSTGVPPLGVR